MAAQVLALLLALFLAGCATAPGPAPDDDNWQLHSQALNQLKQWSANGKIALRNNEQAESATMRWDQIDNLTELKLSGPMGLNNTIITSDGAILTINGAQSRQIDISTPAAIKRETGWELPLNSLHFWLKGIPDPQLEIEHLELAAGRLAHLRQDGWSINIDRYAEFAGRTLPTRLLVERDDTRVRVVIQSWMIGNTP